MDLSVTLVALFSVAMGFAMPLLMVAIVLYYKHRRNRMNHETAALLAQKGLPVPPQLLEPPRSAHAGLRAGLVLVGLGVALSIFFADQGPGWSIGLIPGLMGAALLLAWKIEMRSRA